MPGPWEHDHYIVKEKILTLGRKFRVFDPQGHLVAFCKQKAFRLREDIRFYSDEEMRQELFRMRTKKILDFNANLEVVDAQGQVLGSLRRKGWSSILQDLWHIHDPAGQIIARVEEDSLGMALVRRFILDLVPYNYHVRGMDSRDLATIKERFQILGDTYDLRRDPEGGIDQRLLIAATVCVDAIEEE